MPSTVVGNELHAQYERLVEPHVASYNYFLRDGMRLVFDALEPVEIIHPTTGQIHTFSFSTPQVARPVRDDTGGRADDVRLMPRDCREGGYTYRGLLSCRFHAMVEGGQISNGRDEEVVVEKRLGSIPIMVKSALCHLAGRTRDELVAAKEEANEMGGYFVCNGLERIIRMLIMQRRHYIMALKRSAYRKRGSNYTEAATLLRCVQPDQSSSTVRCHYLTDGTVNFAFTMRKSEYFIPAGILLKCFIQVTDKELFDKILSAAPPGSGHASFVAERAELLLIRATKSGLRTRAQCVEYLGSHFRVALDQPARKSDHDVGLYLLDKFVFTHLSEPSDKLQMLLQMLHKLYALVNSACCEDNADALSHHEVLLPGHLLMKFLKEKLEDCMLGFKEAVKRDLEKSPAGVDLMDPKYLKRHLDRMPDIGKKMEYFLNTGNLVSRSGLDLSQTTGFSMRTTTVRKLLPESWGFMCPVHTPDGSPCGLLNHFAAAAAVVNQGPEDVGATNRGLAHVLLNLGMIQETSVSMVLPSPPNYLGVMLDGRVLGVVKATGAQALVDRLRTLKAANMQLLEGLAPCIPLTRHELSIPIHLEVAFIAYENGGPYPGIFLFTQTARLIRPVTQLRTNARELLGTLEQFNMSIRCPDAGFGGSPSLPFTHSETHAGAILSVVASMTPYSDFNQSPRNMYQCQMAKQTMGTPMQGQGQGPAALMAIAAAPALPEASQLGTTRQPRWTPVSLPPGRLPRMCAVAECCALAACPATSVDQQVSPLVPTAIVGLTAASDTEVAAGCGSSMGTRRFPKRAGGKPEFERALGAFGQTLPQNIPTPATSDAVSDLGVVPDGAHKDSDHLDSDGLPHIGAIIWPRQSYYSSKDLISGKHKAAPLKGEEVGVVDQVTVVGVKGKTNEIQKAHIRMRFNRNPVLGDKFASRHGQKGVLSILWPDVNMPFCPSTGIRPDLIINPHAFPSRMTIGMLVESLVSKGGALKGEHVDASPFQRCDGKALGNPVEGWGTYLEAQGFAKYGQETMISGSTGLEMPCDIFIGLVYYQRLRHMVSDKFQVRSTGPINSLTRQPVKGRKAGGGIRFGEMERDSLLAHGAAYLLHDRLHASSDYHVLDVCCKCGSLLAPVFKPVVVTGGAQSRDNSGGLDGTVVCPSCDGSSKHIERIAMPYVFKYLATELACMNIKVSLDVK
ncbi:MAG: hypothetical protein WDW38_001834 [Sanguina aurantia]